MKKSLTLVMSIMMAFAVSFTAFAETVETNGTRFENNAKGERPAKPENEIIGKIKSISATEVTIEVATRKEMNANQNDTNGMRKPPEMTQGNEQQGNPPELPQNDTQNGNPPEKPNLDEMFTLTGETKTINIESAEFGKDFRPDDFNKDNKNSNAANNSNKAKTDEKAKTKTYADFAVGDYIMIEATDNTYKTAKYVRDAERMGGPRGGFGNKNDPPKNLDR